VSCVAQPGTLTWLNAVKDDNGRVLDFAVSGLPPGKILLTTNNELIPADLPGLWRARVNIRKSCPTATFRTLLRVRIRHLRADKAGRSRIAWHITNFTAGAAGTASAGGS